MAFATTGASLVLTTPRLNTSEALAPAKSVPVTLTDTVPTSPFSGVPLKVRVAALKFSQVGNGSPLANVALKATLSPTSTSANALAGTVKLNTASSLVD